ncbi:hypothetical protein [Fibrobacter sp. UWB13]|uniref:hypothetical protein n=1 Tax=Fibrobacter sp. UWB13 TaxID=1896204 RepID=UPI000A0B66E3|nr:hypothetical protein [Fibrobacter sp. UWB13]SMG38786.1 hypothetical protein SAMN05720489_2678 [Fibrobacter sp. UWB13]
MFRGIFGGVISALLLGVVACSDDNPSGGIDDSISEGDSCSSIEALSSDDSVIESSSSGAVKTARYNLWDPAVDYKVNTGDDSTGFWRTFGDNLFGLQGESKIIFPVELENSSTPLSSVFKHCDGLCGSIEPDYLMIGPWAGVEIPLAKEGSTADISSWGGICVTYESDYSISVYLKVQVDGFDSNSLTKPFEAYPANYLSETTIGESPAPTLFNLFSTNEAQTECMKWSSFDVSSWAKNSGSSQISKVYTGDEAAKEIQSIMFVIKSRGDDENKVFNIKGISTYDPSNATQGWKYPDEKFYDRFPVDDTLTCLWKGGLGDTHVKTGYNDRDEYAGMLVPFDESPANSYAHIEFPAYPSMEYDPYMYESVIWECAGFCGTMDINLDGSDYAVGGISFNIAGYTDDYVFENIQDWGGVCVTYFSEKDAFLNFVVKDVPYENSPKVDLPKSSGLVEKCFTWNEIAPNDPDMGRAVGAIQFAIKGTVDYEKFRFNLAGIGEYSVNGACSIETPVITPKSSSSAWIRSSSSVDTTKHHKLYVEEQCILLSDLWSFFGAVFTGCNRSEDDNAGHWYTIEDTSDENKSSFTQPLTDEEKANLIDDGVQFPDSCGRSHRSLYEGGVCGTAVFKDDYFAGFGFYVAGIDHNDGTLLSGDADKLWGGICVTYASEADIDVVMNSTGVHDISQLPKLPKATLPKSSEVVTSCLTWDEFKSDDGKLVDPKNLTTVNFVVYGAKGTRKKINIHGLGKYSTYAEYDYSLKCPIEEHFVTE